MIIKPPNRKYQVGLRSVFLAGSIEQGTATDWQTDACVALNTHSVCIFNPRRDEWDPTWEQSIDHPKFKEQVDWELDMLDQATLKLFYFVPYTKSPVTLMELGLVAKDQGHSTIVCCPDGFWRKGNVDIVCARYNIKQATNFKSLLTLAKKYL